MDNNIARGGFGLYKPDASTLLLRALTWLGVGRGAIKKWIAQQWVEKGYSIVDATVRGVNYRLDLRDNPTDAKILTASRYYDRRELLYLAAAMADPAHDTFVDVGANTGYYSLNLARLGYTRIIAIEANPPTVARLRFNVEANDMERTITVVPLCIGDGEDVPFYTSGGLGSASVFSESHGTATPIMVPTKPLLNILVDLGVRRVGGLKIDVEGFEDRCLIPFFESAPRELWPGVVVIEHCNRNLWQRDVIETMEGLGYRQVYESRGNKVFKLRGGAS